MPAIRDRCALNRRAATRRTQLTHSNGSITLALTWLRARDMGCFANQRHSAVVLACRGGNYEMKSTLAPEFMKRMAAGAVVFMALSLSSFAQTTSGDLTGTVYDATGAVVPNAMVTATGESTGVASTTTTTSSGQYRINNLLVGKY